MRKIGSHIRNNGIPTWRNLQIWNPIIDHEDQLSLLLFNFALEYQLLVYAYDVDMLGENLQTVRENIEIFIKASKEIGLEVNSE